MESTSLKDSSNDINIDSRQNDLNTNKDNVVRRRVGENKKEINSAILTPRSRSPLGIIPIHSKYRGIIHKYEIPRKLFHVSIGFLTLKLYKCGYVINDITPVLIFLLVLIGSADILRFRYKKFSKLYIKFLGSLMRESEVNNWNGVIWYLLGLIIVFLIFPLDISVLSVLLLSWADTTASVFGRKFGYLSFKYGRKSLIGSFAAFITSFLAAFYWYNLLISTSKDNLALTSSLAYTPQSSKLSLFHFSLLAGFIGSLSEAISFYGIDDNLTIPVISACFLWPICILYRK